MDAWVTVREAAEMLGVSASRVHQLIENDQLPATRLHARAWVIRRKDVEAFAALPEGHRAIHASCGGGGGEDPFGMFLSQALPGFTYGLRWGRGQACPVFCQGRSR
jgi:excisionase family DNA binding protein